MDGESTVTEPVNYVSASLVFPPPFPEVCQVPSFFDGTTAEYLLSELYKIGPWVSTKGILFDRSGPCEWPTELKRLSERLQSEREQTQIVGSILSTLPPEPVFQDPILSAEEEFTESWDALNAPDVFGVRIIFSSEQEPETTVVVFAPTLFANQDDAVELLAKLTAPNGIRLLLGWKFLGWRLPDNHSWLPLGMRVCRLSEAPF
jgi:hypothetical protein